ncbi:MAG: NAD(P)H-dependent oxidoreductase [Pseudomonadota bacterium]
MNVLLIDGHPDTGRYCTHMLDVYAKALPPSATIHQVALRDLSFSPHLRHGYAKRTEWEPDIAAMAERLDACDHVVFAFPMWWGAEPAELKGLLDRLMLPGFTFSYHEQDTWWDKHMVGRSADVIITMDTPPLFHRLAHGNAIINRWKKQILEFAGFKPVRILPMGQIKRGGVERNGAKWEARVRKMAASSGPKHPEKKEARLERFLNPAD